MGADRGVSEVPGSLSGTDHVPRLAQAVASASGEIEQGDERAVRAEDRVGRRERTVIHRVRVGDLVVYGSLL
jgi:hypothetical protein